VRSWVQKVGVANFMVGALALRLRLAGCDVRRAAAGDRIRTLLTGAQCAFAQDCQKRAGGIGSALIA